MINKFKCGLCKLGNEYIGTRKGLRDHLRFEHSILNRITNSQGKRQAGNPYIKQGWWNVEKMK